MRLLFHFYLLDKTKKTDSLHLVNHQNKKTGQPHSLVTTVCPFECTVIALPRCMIYSAHKYFRFLDGVVPAITTKPQDVDEQSGMNFTWSETPKSGFLLQELKIRSLEYTSTTTSK